MDGLAVGYPDQYSSVPVGYIDMSNVYAAGALYSTVEDLYRWEQALYTEQLVPQTYLDQMFSSYAVTPYYGGLGYGYGWFIGTERDQSIHTHSGIIDGYTTIITRYPNEKITIIVLGNVQNKDVGSIHDVLSRKVFGDD
jgi:CubicO group peptidase (beta-lactamase class C family)